MLPRVIRDFGTLHPGVRFTLKQGDYTRNAQWVHDGVVDFCFTARGFTAGSRSVWSITTSWWRCCRLRIRWRQRKR